MAAKRSARGDRRLWRRLAEPQRSRQRIPRRGRALRQRGERALDDALVGPGERVGRGGLDGVDPRQPVEDAEARGFDERLDAGAGERAAADLDDEVVELAAGAQELGDHLPGERLAALDHQRVLVSLAGEGDRAAGDLLAVAQVAGVAALARSARTDSELGAEPLEPRDHRGLGVRGDEDAQRPTQSARHHRRGERRVAAARHGEGRGNGDRSTNFPLDLPTATRRAEIGAFPRVPGSPARARGRRSAAPLRARDVAGFVLHPELARLSEPERRGERGMGSERGDPEAVAVHRGDGRVEPRDELGELRVAPPAEGDGRLVAVEQAPVTAERVRLLM